MVVEANSLIYCLQSEAEASYYHTHKLISTASFDAQTVQTDALFTAKLETRFKNHPKNKTGAGILVSRLKEDGGLPTKVLPFCPLSRLLVTPTELRCMCNASMNRHNLRQYHRCSLYIDIMPSSLQEEGVIHALGLNLI